MPLPVNAKNRQLHNFGQTTIIARPTVPGRQLRSVDYPHRQGIPSRKITDLMTSPAVFNSRAAVPRMEMAYPCKCRFYFSSPNLRCEERKSRKCARTVLLLPQEIKILGKNDFTGRYGHARTGRAGGETGGDQRRADARAISDVPIRHRDSP